MDLFEAVCVGLVFCAATVIASPAQTFTTLASFYGDNGGYPVSSLIQATDGNLYGGTSVDGAFNFGTIFKITPAGTLATVYNFVNGDGASPYAPVNQATDGNLYGTTFYGGTSSVGTVFKITAYGTLITLHNFTGTDGANPFAGLIQATDGNLYGTASSGGANAAGTVFRITADGTLTTLHSFNHTDGNTPFGPLVLASDGNLYGTTLGGGANGSGTVFKITLDGTLTTLYSFCSQAGCSDGSSPYAGVTQGTDGNFYGTTQRGGAGNLGTIYKVTSTGALSTLHSFMGSDGANPIAGLIQATDGSFYGTTQRGGAGNNGTVFRITSAGVLTTLHSFSGSDGALPYGGLVQASNGSFYGTTFSGGEYGAGTVFSLSVNLQSDPLQFVPVKPCRLLDTRPEYGGKGPIPGGTFQIFDLKQLAKTNGCDDLHLAEAYSLNVSVVPEGGLGYLTTWPAGRPQPLVATLNSYDGRVKAVAAIVQGGASDAISVFVTNTTNVILDISGYFAPAAFQFFPLPPCRVADTRDGSFPLGLGPPYLTGGVQRDFPLLKASSCFPPGVNPIAYSLNFSAVPHGFLGYLTVWPAGQDQPIVSTLNAYGGQVTANAAIVPAGTNGSISTYALDDTDLVVDINGYFALPGQGGLSLYPVVPCRALDTRTAYGGNGPFNGTLGPPVDLVHSPCAVAATAKAYVLNATVVPTGELGYLTLWPDGQMQPIVSTLNAYDGIVTSNMAVVPAGDQGRIDAYADEDTSPTDLILDISSYFAP